MKIVDIITQAVRLYKVLYNKKWRVRNGSSNFEKNIL